MRIVIALLAAILAASQALAETQQDFVGGAGATRCDTWLKERAQNASILSLGMEGWVLGFVSGVNIGSPVRGFITNVSEDDVYSRVDFYCREHPTEILFQAARAATADLMRARAQAIEKQMKAR